VWPCRSSWVCAESGRQPTRIATVAGHDPPTRPHCAGDGGAATDQNPVRLDRPGRLRRQPLQADSHRWRGGMVIGETDSERSGRTGVRPGRVEHRPAHRRQEVVAVEISLGPSRPAVPPLGLGLAPDQAIAPGCIPHGDHPARSIPHLDLSLRLWKPGGSRVRQSPNTRGKVRWSSRRALGAGCRWAWSARRSRHSSIQRVLVRAAAVQRLLIGPACTRRRPRCGRSVTGSPSTVTSQRSSAAVRCRCSRPGHDAPTQDAQREDQAVAPPNDARRRRRRRRRPWPDAVAGGRSRGIVPGAVHCPGRVAGRPLQGRRS
jgi:hypothetical protein